MPDYQKINDTNKLEIFKKEYQTKTVFFRRHKEDEDGEYVRIYEEQDGKYIFNYDSKSIEEVIVKNHDEFPSMMNNYGYGFKNYMIERFFTYNFDSESVNKIEISDNDSKIRGSKLIINQDEFSDLQTTLNQEKYAFDENVRTIIGNYLSVTFPNIGYEYKPSNSNKDLVLRNLNKELIEKLNAEEVEEIGRFYVEAASKYKRQDLIDRMVIGLQKNAKILTLKRLIDKYEKLIEKDPPEQEWQKLFDDYITLFDNRYVTKLDYKNIDIGVTKYPDLVLIDIYGFIDFYELKKSGTQLLKYDGSHRTYYWSKEVSMLISQAQNYLQKAKENALAYAQKIKELTEGEDSEGLEVNIVSPKAIVVAGTRNQLDTDIKSKQFKNLRESLKDIEFILYDELLDRLKNLIDHIQHNEN